MKKFTAAILLPFCLLLSFHSKAFNGTWERYTGATVPIKGEQKLKPQRFDVFAMNTMPFKDFLFSLPSAREKGKEIELPAPDGSYRNYIVWQSPVMEEGLAVKYPGIKTFSGYAADNKSATIKMDFTESGFHAMIMDGRATYFIDPMSDAQDGFYMVYYRKDYVQPANSYMHCAVTDDNDLKEGEALYLTDNGLPDLQYKLNGATKKTYRLALACTGEYAVAVAGMNPTKSAVLSAMVTSINRVNNVYERELGVSLNLIANTDTLIFLHAGFDVDLNPYSNSDGGGMLNQNQNIINNRIGSANYDIGHVFSTGGGGIANLACVCKSDKARGVTGQSNPVGDPFDIDYVAHEMGHQFGANHTFNANTSSCSGNGNSSTAYEPGSGSTIMAYAGICGSGNNIQGHSDAYFHAASLTEIFNYLNSSTGGGSCPIEIPSGNTPPSVPAFSSSYSIPQSTPFEITAPEAIDADHDTLTYCWEQYNRGNFKTSFNAVSTRGPIFRSFKPDTSRTRVFPQISKVLAGVTYYIGEKLPDTPRYLTFRLTVRDIYNGAGTFNIPDDTIHLDVVSSSGPFKVTAPAALTSWDGWSQQTITWDVANTDIAPVSCDSVIIYLSIDGGYTYPYILNEGTPNDGSEVITVPNVSTTTARVKVKGKGNVFFNVNTSDITINFNTAVDDVSWENQVDVYPVPATERIFITNKTSQSLETAVFNLLGQKIFTGKISQHFILSVNDWAKGIYYLQLSNNKGEKIAKPIIIQ